MKIKKAPYSKLEHIGHQGAIYYQKSIKKISLLFNKVIGAALYLGETIKITARGYTLRVATFFDYPKVAKALLRGGPISNRAREKSLINAINHKNQSIIEALISNGPISSDGRGNSIIRALKTNQPSLAELLLKEGSISNDHRGEALIEALKKNQIELVDQLLKNASISEQHRKACILNAASCGHLKAFEAFIKITPISQEDRGKALLNAAASGHLAIIETLIEMGPILAHYQNQAIKIGNPLIIEKLRAHDPKRGLELQTAAQNGDLLSLQSILKKGAISPYYRGIAIQSASYNKHQAIVLELLKNNPKIPIKERSLSVRNAAFYGHEAIVIALLQNGPISEEERGTATVHAAWNEHFDIIPLLLENGPISEVSRGLAVRNAAYYSDLNTVEALLLNGNGNISQIDRGIALRIAVERSNIDITSLLIQRGSISPTDRNLAIEIAMSNQNNVIVQLLTNGITIQGASPRLRVNREKLQKNPSFYLKEAKKGFCGITFLNADADDTSHTDDAVQPGLDGGGLTKQFIHELFKHLCLQKVIQFDENRFPIFQPSSSEDDYKNLGELISVIDEKNKDKKDRIFINPIFNSKVFQHFKNFLDPTLSDDDKIKKLADDLKNQSTSSFIKFLNNSDPSPKEIEDFKTFLEEVYFESYEKASLKDLQEEAKKPFEKTFKAISLIISGFSNSLKEKIKKHGEHYARVLQAPLTISKEELLAKLTPQGNNPQVLEKCQWLREKITEESDKKDSTWIKDFLTCVTAQPALPDGIIKINGIGGVFCTAGTCSNVLNVPVSNETPHIKENHLSPKERFLKNLEITMAVKDYGST